MKRFNIGSGFFFFLILVLSASSARAWEDDAQYRDLNYLAGVLQAANSANQPFSLEFGRCPHDRIHKYDNDHFGREQKKSKNEMLNLYNQVIRRSLVHSIDTAKNALETSQSLSNPILRVLYLEIFSMISETVLPPRATLKDRDESSLEKENTFLLNVYFRFQSEIRSRLKTIDSMRTLPCGGELNLHEEDSAPSATAVVAAAP